MQVAQEIRPQAGLTREMLTHVLMRRLITKVISRDGAIILMSYSNSLTALYNVIH